MLESRLDRPHSLPSDTPSLPDTDRDEFEDASEQVQYSQSLDLLDTIAETQITLNLFLNNKFDLAEDRMRELADRSMYHSLGLSSMVFIKAMMTCDRKDMDKAVQAAKNALAVAESKRQRLSLSESFSYLGGGKTRALSDEELHAELLYAECLLFRAVLSFFQDDNLTSFVRGALKIRSCYQTYRACQRLLQDPSTWVDRDPRVKAQFESGVRMGVGTFNLMLSTLPSKVLRLLEVVGFSGDKTVGHFEMLQCAAMTDTVRAPLCSLLLLTFHLVACFMFGVGRPDIPLCRRLLKPLIEKYPNGNLILFLRGRLSLVTSQIDNAIYFFNKSIESQDIYVQFHHGCYWELLFAHCYLRQWTAAANYANLLMRESRWSRSIYTYMLAIFMAQDETVEESKRDETVRVLAKKVDGYRTKIAGKSIPFEKFCSRRADRFLRTGSLLFANYEYMYFWNAFDIIGQNAELIAPMHEEMERIWERKAQAADKNDECVYQFLSGMCLRALHSPFQAEHAFMHVINCEPVLTDMFYLVPVAVYELAILRIAEGRRDEAEQLLNKARSYKGYSLENKLHFRIHSAMEQMGTRTPA